ncbi:MAG: hypothetical protein NT167_31675, partial [Verrucomicrobia bacterium]|nr:hypothetical protein [Verrucomicrobiota bacterium]
MNIHQTSLTGRGWRRGCTPSASRRSTLDAQRSTFSLSVAGPALALAALLLAGCAAPIGADRVTTRQAYAQV